MTEATPKTPFLIAPRRSFGRAIILDADGEQIAATAKGRPDTEAIAALLVTSSNAHAALVEALDGLLSPRGGAYATPDRLAKARAALALARDGETNGEKS